jgi:hypothetical protein
MRQPFDTYSTLSGATPMGLGFLMPYAGARLTITAQWKNPDALSLFINGQKRAFVEIGFVGSNGLNQP